MNFFRACQRRVVVWPAHVAVIVDTGLKRDVRRLRIERTVEDIEHLMNQRRFLVTKDVLDERLDFGTGGDREDLRRRNADGRAKLSQKATDTSNRGRAENVDNR